eukprot:GILK01002471.1.p1 GENE.GILK01002471.1~~GILK01002471.1.p1  ORF type:complete len:780 (-),score=110.70 GILK01002471.1:227-2566(-)
MKSLQFPVTGDGKPNVDVAQQFAFEDSVFDLNGRKMPLTASPKRLGDLGVGIQLYFDFTKILGIILFLMSILAVPIIMVNSAGKQVAYEDQKTTLELTTLGNQGNYMDADGFMYIEVQGQVYKQTDISLVISLLDVGYCLVFLLFILAFRSREKAVSQENDDDHITPADYAVEITRLPVHGVTSKQLGDLFSQFGPVVEAAVARRYNGVISKYKLRFRLMNKLNFLRATLGEAHKKVRKMKNKMQKLEAEIADVNPDSRSMDDLECVRGYVVFDTQSARTACLRAYAWSNTWFGRWMMPRRYRFGRTALRVDPAPEPGNILWANLEVTSKERFKRKLFTNTFTVLLLVISFGLIYAAKRAQQSLPNTDDCSALDSTYSSYFMDMNAPNDPAYSDYSSELKVCWCRSRGWTTALSSYPSFCSDFFLQVAQIQGLTFCSSIGVVIVNYLLKWTLRALTKFEKHSSRTVLMRETMIKVFLSQFLNTAAIVLLVNAKFNDDTTASIFTGKYVDFDRSWYSSVGASIIIMMILNCVIPPAVTLVRAPFQRCKQRRLAKRMQTQEELNKLYRLPRFEIATRYAQTLNTVFVSLLYSSGLPILIPLATICVFIAYWVDKYMLLRKCRKPPAYDNRISKFATSMLPLSLMLHSAFAVWMLGDGATMQSNYISNTWISSANSVFGSDVSAGSSLSVGDRILRLSGFPIFVFLVLLTIGFILSKTAVKMMRNCWRCLCCCCSNRYKVDISPDTNATFKSELPRMRKLGLASYDIRNNPQYREAIAAFNI